MSATREKPDGRTSEFNPYNVGVEGNEIADELAKDGVVNGLPVAVDQPKMEIL